MIYNYLKPFANLVQRKCYFELKACIHMTSEIISLKNENLLKYLNALKSEFYALRLSSLESEKDHLRMRRLSDVVDSYEKRNCLILNLQNLNDMEKEKDEEMKELVKEEKQVYTKMLENLENKIIDQLLQSCAPKKCSEIFFEINAGVGGQEAMLFASDLFRMYENFFCYKNWDYEIIEKEESPIGGIRRATMMINNDNAFEYLQNEAGVHRVQRVPANEKSGRMHTSTTVVAVIPKHDDINLELDEKSLKIETKRASGAGGQHVNTTDSAVRVTHIPSGTTVECQTERSQVKNRTIALKKLENILIQKQLTAQEEERTSLRKSQIGTRNRNEKIRTYNFTQDRITDHRLKNGTFHNLKDFLNGDRALDNLIQQIIYDERCKALLYIVNNIEFK
ncbi:peptide chain release factor 1-like, mitochondrial [Condylostylus longicornis]|uniref:peptide chain release factor 1-like, mitochondrial n=1 Tax=Condylostylus longicornis TaxID=2530218 RepID=UPI00244DAE6A|nr:peptide chain release factor 1-like, mitochondrial [Condylostylus longicornis]